MESNEIICFVCDKMFPINNLQNHVNKCKVIYEQQNKVHLNMPEEYKILLDAYKGGVLPDYETLENFNRMIEEKSVKYGGSIATNAEFREQNKDFEETIKKSKEPIKHKRAPGQKPIGLICPLCGREFGTMSLKFHLKSCKQKFDLAQASLPPNKRRNADKIIASYEANQNRGFGGSGNYYNNMDALNQQAFDQYNKDALVECEYCGRTFLPDRLPVHQKVCAKHPEMFKKKK
jgi:hypothetical protein